MANRFWRRRSFFSAVLVVACGNDADRADVQAENRTGEEVGTAVGKLSQRCASAKADVKVAKSFSLTSPSVYGQADCGKGFVADVDNYALGNIAGRPQGSPPESGATRVEWIGGDGTGSADPDLATQEGCESSWLAAYLFEHPDGQSTWVAKDFKSSQGVWNGGSCRRPFVDFSAAQMPTMHAYRIAASARTEPTTAAPVRYLSITTNTSPR